jgi:hypothetical protein
MSAVTSSTSTARTRGIQEHWHNLDEMYRACFITHRSIAAKAATYHHVAAVVKSETALQVVMERVLPDSSVGKVEGVVEVQRW